MDISAEVRWFWKEEAAALTAAAKEWFTRGVSTIEVGGGGRAREDVYARDGRGDIGVKRRGGKAGLEVKALISVAGPISIGEAGALVELWGKSSTTAAVGLDSEQVQTTRKVRLLRKFDASAKEIPLDKEENPLDKDAGRPPVGCNVEFTSVVCDDVSDNWWTIGFEAFGPLESVERILRSTVHLLSCRAPLDLRRAQPLSYPQWLATVSAAPPER